MAGANGAEDKLRGVFSSVQAIKAGIYLLMHNIDVSARRIWDCAILDIWVSKISRVLVSSGGRCPGAGDVSHRSPCSRDTLEDRP